MCKKCDGLGIVFHVIEGYDWYQVGGFTTEAVEEDWCECDAGDAAKLRYKAENAHREIERGIVEEAEKRAAALAGVEWIPF